MAFRRLRSFGRQLHQIFKTLLFQRNISSRDLRLTMRVGRQQIRRDKTSGMGDKRASSVDHRAQSVVDAIQWATAKVFGVSLHDLAFGTTTLHINDYPEQLRLARTAALYLCRKHTGRAAAPTPR